MDQQLYDLMDWAEIETIVYSEHDHPETVLGAHKVRSGILIQAFLPNANSVFVRRKKDGKLYRMEEVDEAGFYAALIAERKIFAYELLIRYEDGTEQRCEDAYSYLISLPQKDLKLFAEGKHFEIYRYLGAHPVCVAGCGKETTIYWDKKAKAPTDAVQGTFFAVWAPNALRVSVVGDFNQWDGRIHSMCRLGDSGVFALFIPRVSPGELYKYEVKANPQKIVLKSDPYGFRGEMRPANASIVTDLSDYCWHDAKWMEARKKKQFEKEPMSVYEVHLGSWKRMRQPEGEIENEGFLNYREIASALADYVKKMGYTHVEILPVMEHPLDESWGYQVTGYYAVTARYGTPDDFMYFIDYMHQKGIGVILDWVPAYFPKDENGLARFDGTCLYEHLDPRQGEHLHWGTLLYNYARPQVSNFLIANALFWKDIYHADGLRLDAVASMLYLDYGKQDGEWIPNEYGGKENLAAIRMLQQLSQVFHQKNDGALLIAEESAAWQGVTASVASGGLGFDLKWNMGWMNDFISYMKIDPYFRKGSHNMLVFSMIYAYSERFLLVLSHDEVVHGKGSLLMKMPGDSGQKFGNLRAVFGFMITHPGKKFHFMGQEFAQKGEWSEKESLPWELLKEKPHAGMQKYVSEINAFYKRHPALYEGDYDESGFEWISCLDADHSIIAFMRRDTVKTEQLLVVCNFTPVLYENFKVGVPFSGKYKEIFNSDKEIYGGSGCINRRQITSKAVRWDGRANSITLNLPPLGVCIFNCIPQE